MSEFSVSDIVNARLECLKLAHRHDKSAQETIERAWTYVNFALSHVPDTPSDDGPGQSEDTKPRRGRPPKTTQKQAP